MNWNGKDANGLCVSIFLKATVCYLGVIGKFHNYECLIYFSHVNLSMVIQLYFINCIIIVVINNKGIKFSPLIIGTTHKNVDLLNKINGKITSNGVIDQN